jgi:hypothetical protein
MRSRRLPRGGCWGAGIRRDNAFGCATFPPGGRASRVFTRVRDPGTDMSGSPGLKPPFSGLSSKCLSQARSSCDCSVVSSCSVDRFARSSANSEYQTLTVGVTGSIPVAPTINSLFLHGFWEHGGGLCGLTANRDRSQRSSRSAMMASVAIATSISSRGLFPW